MGAHLSKMLRGYSGFELFKLGMIGIGLPLFITIGIYKYATREIDPIK
jgi:hypothetical protein